MGKENKKTSKKMKQTSINDAANVIRISRRHTRDWHLIGLERQRLRTGRPRGPDLHQGPVMSDATLAEVSLIMSSRFETPGFLIVQFYIFFPEFRIYSRKID